MRRHLRADRSRVGAGLRTLKPASDASDDQGMEAGHALDRFERHLMDGVTWPCRLSSFHAQASLQPPRMQQLRPVRRNIGFYSEKMRRVVECESRTERRFYELLDSVPSVLYYQEQPHRIPQRSAKERYYYPDVLVTFVSGHSVLAEIKAPNDLVLYDNLVKWRALFTNCERIGWGVFIGNERASLRRLVLATPRGALVSAMKTELKRRPLTKEWIERAKRNLLASALDVNVAILELGLVAESSPFRVREPYPAEAARIRDLKRWFAAAGADAGPPKDSPNGRVAGLDDSVEPEVAARKRVAAVRRRRSISSSLSSAYPNAYKPWSELEERRLLRHHAHGIEVGAIARRLGRQPSAIRSRLRRLGVG